MTNIVATLVVTAYVWSGAKCANNHYPVVGVTCAADKSIPLGTMLYIEKVGWRRVDDRINDRFHGTRVDLYVGRSVRKARKWGAPRLKVIRRK